MDDAPQAPDSGKLALRRARAAHDRPKVDDLFAPGHVIAVVDVGAHIQIRWIQFHPLTELEVAARSANALKARIKHASFPVEKDFETFDFSVACAPV